MPSSSREREAREQRERVRRFAARRTVHDARIARRRRDNVIAVIALVVVATLATVAQIGYLSGPGAPVAEPAPSASADPSASPADDPVPSPDLAEGRTWTGQLTLDDTVLDIELDGAAAPQAVASFVQTARDGVFDGRTCHRLVASDTAGLLQCGSADGRGGPEPSGYAFGPIENAPADGVYPAGTLAMARLGGDGDSNGRQFFIVTSDTQLPDDAAGGYTVFGRVTGGLDALRAAVTDAGTADGAADGAPAVPTTITSVTVS